METLRLYTVTGHRNLVAGANGFQWEIRGEGGKILATFEESGSDLKLTREYVHAGLLPVASRNAATGVVSHLHTDATGNVKLDDRAGCTTAGETRDGRAERCAILFRRS